MTITVSVPLVFWDGARMEIGTDGTYLINSAKVGDSAPEPESLPVLRHKYRRHSPPPASLCRHIQQWRACGGRTGGHGHGHVVSPGPEQPDRPACGARPASQGSRATTPRPQLTEWTIARYGAEYHQPEHRHRSPVFGETHANINYDVSYVDSMALPVAMEALDVPVPVQTVPPLDPAQSQPGAAASLWLDRGGQTAADSRPPSSAFTQSRSRRTVWERISTDKAGPRTILPPSAFPAGVPSIKIPSGQDAIQDTPLADKSSSYDILANLYMLTSGGTTPKQSWAGPRLSRTVRTRCISWPRPINNLSSSKNCSGE